MRVSPKPSPNRYSDDFRTDALNLIRRGDRSFRQLAADLGVNSWTLRHWWTNDQMAKRKRSSTPSSDEAASSNETSEQKLARLELENRRLVRENEQLRMDREILKKAAAFFAKESE
jgi:transposase